MLENYLEEQPIVTKLLLDSFDKNTLVQAYLFVCDDINYIYDYAISFSKKLITEDYNTNICTKIDNNSYNELMTIFPINGIIKKEQLLDLQNNFKTKNLEGKKKIYVIKNCDKLNSAAGNCMLKFLEEPQENIVAILLTDNIDSVMSTIKSRCQILNFLNKTDKDKKLFNALYNQYKEKCDEKENLEEYFKKNIMYIENIEKENIKFINKYKDFFNIIKNKDDFALFFTILLYFYYDLLNFNIGNDICYMVQYMDLIEKYSQNNNINNLIKKINLVQNEKKKLDSNMNMKLLMDEFLIKLNEVGNEKN